MKQKPSNWLDGPLQRRAKVQQAKSKRDDAQRSAGMFAIPGQVDRKVANIPALRCASSLFDLACCTFALRCNGPSSQFEGFCFIFQGLSLGLQD